MKLLISNAQNYLMDQTDINRSLGGFMSSTSVPNKKLNAIFSDVSQLSLKNKTQNVLGFFLYNETSAPIMNITMECIYQSQFGTPINLCDFEFSIAEPSENGAIELIGSIFEEPFSTDWFECESKSEFCIIQILTPGLIGDDISIFGEIGTITGNDILSLQNDIVNLMNSNPDFTASIVDENKVYIQRKDFTSTGLNSDFLTSGLATILADQNLSGAKNGLTLIYDSLLSEKSIGIWFKRKINENYKKLSTGCEIPEKEIVPVTVEDFKVLFHHD